MYRFPTRIFPIHDTRWPIGLRRFLGGACLVFGLIVAPGCHHETKTETKSISESPIVHLMRPQRRKIVRTVGQPSFVEAYERASIYPKLTAYIEKWYVDIGDKVKKDQVLADLFVPEIEERYKTKGATVEFDKQRVLWAIEQVKVAKADVAAAAARLQAAKAILDQYQSQVTRWDVEVKRLRREVQRGVVDPQVLLESENQLRASIASRDAAVAEILKAEADLESKKSTYAKSKVAVDVAKAKVGVATSDWKELGAWVGYLKLYAPFDGIISARNANTGDFVLPRAGDPTADSRAPHLSPSGNAAPIYVVDRTDVVRVFVDVPEADANYVKKGTKATVLVKAFRDQPIQATVARTSWALNFTSRTLRAEIDLVNDELPAVYQDPGAHQEPAMRDANVQLLPGMYAYGYVIIERPNVMAIPTDAVAHVGDKTFCWVYKNGRAVRNEIETGISDSKWIEVTSSRVSASQMTVSGGTDWSSYDGSEQVVVGDLSTLTEDTPVRVDLATNGTPAPGVNPESTDTPAYAAAPSQSSFKPNPPDMKSTASESARPAPNVLAHTRKHDGI